MVAKTAVSDKPVHLVISNGPGTCLPILYAYFLVSKVLLFNVWAKIVFVESFCRVQELSLTAKLVKPICDVIVV